MKIELVILLELRFLILKKESLDQIKLSSLLLWYSGILILLSDFTFNSDRNNTLIDTVLKEKSVILPIIEISSVSRLIYYK